MFIVNQMDRDHADFMKVQTQLRERFGNSVVPILLPIGEGPGYHGVVNVLENKAYERVNKGKPKEIPVRPIWRMKSPWPWKKSPKPPQWRMMNSP